jgi:hypothetical protein
MPLTIWQTARSKFSPGRKWRNSVTGFAILENVRRNRTIASLYRQTAAFRLDQKWSLLTQAYEYERRAIAELEAHYTGATA